MKKLLCTLVLFIAWAILCLLSVRVFAHTVTLEDGSIFAFDQFCCNERDCQEVPLSAIQQKDDGWAVDYVAKDGRRVRGFIREGAVGQKWSPNHQVFACHYAALRNNDGSYLPRCIYPQKPGM